MIAACCFVLTPLAWLACAGSYFVEWSFFTAGPPRPRAAGAAWTPGGAPTPMEERDETHWMFGHGRVAICSNTVYTRSFANPMADLNSRALAWATVDDFFIGMPVRFDWYPAGPLMGVSLWIPAAALTALGVVLLAAGPLRVWRKRQPWECVLCGYDLRGMAGRSESAARCPECGWAEPPA